MDLFNRLKIGSDCYLCGCTVASIHVDRNLMQLTPIICQQCHSKLPLAKNNCITCGLPLAKIEQIGGRSVPCGECLKNSPPFDVTLSAFHYEPPIKEFITQLKFSAELRLLSILCDYLNIRISEYYSNHSLPTHVIAVPLHPKKQIQRGFNQSKLIADKIAKRLKIKVINKEVKRVKQTKAQSGLDSVERQSNVKNAFKIDTVLPKHIAIVDDVITTGKTVSELAKQARKQGAERIDVWSIARAYAI